MTTFSQFNLSDKIMASLEKMSFATPTPVQEKAIPLALEGRDILASAQTGTGKTGAFSIPLVEHVLKNTKNNALVLTPTRELAAQVVKVIHSLIEGTGLKTALLIGGDSMPGQINQLKKRPQIIVGTPGRINDHLTRGSLMLHNANFIVLDETDRMLDMGFGVQLDAIYKFVPKVKQTLMFSATLPHSITKIAQKYLVDPESIAISSMSKPAENITHDMVKIRDEHKFDRLLSELNTRTGSIIVFSKTKWGADKMAVSLRKIGHQAEAIHGDLRQSKRDRVIQGFRKEKFRILVATDVAARGLDIPHIEHVINFDLPQCPEDYIHRIGRTARAGATGSAICFVSPREEKIWKSIHRLMNPDEKPEIDYASRKKPTARKFGKGFSKDFSKGFSKGNGKPTKAEGKTFTPRAKPKADNGEKFTKKPFDKKSPPKGNFAHKRSGSPKAKFGQASAAAPKATASRPAGKPTFKRKRQA